MILLQSHVQSWERIEDGTPEYADWDALIALELALEVSVTVRVDR